MPPPPPPPPPAPTLPLGDVEKLVGEGSAEKDCRIDRCPPEDTVTLVGEFSRERPVPGVMFGVRIGVPEEYASADEGRPNRALVDRLRFNANACRHFSAFISCARLRLERLRFRLRGDPPTGLG